jgi:hypothetical protein
MVTDSALFMQYDRTDTLYLHADTLTFSSDTSGNFKNIQAFYRVSFFRYELQGKCDSLFYSTSDSLIRLFGDPVLWNEQNQLTARLIRIHYNGIEADRLEMDDNAMIISKETPIYFNQIFGKKMTGFIAMNQLYKIIVNGNAQTIYFPSDEEGYLGANKAVSSNMVIYLDEGKVKKISFITAPEGLMNRFGDIGKEELFLTGFKWLGEWRPTKPLDVFGKKIVVEEGIEILPKSQVTPE